MNITKLHREHPTSLNPAPKIYRPLSKARIKRGAPAQGRTQQLVAHYQMVRLRNINTSSTWTQ